MASEAQRILSNTEVRKLAKSFFSSVDRCRCSSRDAILPAIEDGKSLQIIEGYAFAYGNEVSEQLFALTNECIKLLGPSVAHEKDIRDAAWEVMKEPGIDASDRFKSFVGLIAEALKSTTFITNNYAVNFAEQVTSATIGPVRIRLSKDVAVEFEASSTPLRIGPADAPLSVENGKITAPLTPRCWEVEVRATARRSEYLAKRMVNISLSLIRLICLKNPAAPLIPAYGCTEPDPFVATEIERGHIKKTEQAISWGGLELPRPYVIDQKISERLSTKEFRELASQIFDAKKMSAGERIARGLHWMARARQSVDPAERFLLSFTAIEALLSAESAAVPVVDTVARRTATILAASPEDRRKIFQNIKGLYTMRSALVHRGIAEVSDSDTRRLEWFADNIYAGVIDGINIGMSCDEFHASLDRSGFGSVWPAADKQSQATTYR